MSLFKIENGDLAELVRTSFAAEKLREREDIQAALKKNISALAPDCIVISEEFSFWEESRRRIDLLAVDRNANIVVIELKRDETGAHMELQALRYASMVSTLTFNKAAEHFQTYLNAQQEGQDAKSILLNFVDLSEDDLDEFGRDVRIILASADFSKELTTSVLWLRSKQIDISCVRLTPYKHGSEVLINAEQIIPIPEAEEYLVRFREKTNEVMAAGTNTTTRDYSTYLYQGQTYNKRKLALAVMTDWIEEHEPNSLNDLLEVFPKTVHRGIAKSLDEVPDKRLKRFHSNDDCIITLSSGEEIMISNQWSLKSITRLIDKLSEFDFSIEKVSD